MKIIESFIKSKSGKESDCEDGIFTSTNFVAVIDGVTSNSETLWGENKVKSGNYAKEVLLGALAKMPSDIKAENAIDFLSKCLKENYHDNKGCIDNLDEQLQATIIIYSDFHKEIWIYGNCQCLVGTSHLSCQMKTDKVVSEARALYLNELIAEGITVAEIQQSDSGRTFVLPLIKKQRYFQNTDSEYGYAVLNGKQYNLKLLKKYRVEKGTEVVLASDGYPKLFGSLKETENYLQDILKSDPLLIKRFKNTKGVSAGNISYDDRAYIRFKT